MQSRTFILITLAVAAALFAASQLVANNYLFFAGYTVLQFIVLATAWNILGGYCGYVNFGSAAFFALGAYSTVFFYKTFPLPIPLLIAIGGLVSGIVGLGMGYLTLRLRGSFFAIATLALAVVLQTLIVNWDYVGGSRGAYIIRPNTIDIAGHEIPYIEYLFFLMLTLAAQADRHHAVGRADGHGRRAVSLLHRLPAAAVGLRARLRRQFDRDADDRRNGKLDRPADRRHPARHHPRSEEHTSELQSPYVISYAV